MVIVIFSGIIIIVLLRVGRVLSCCMSIMLVWFVVCFGWGLKIVMVFLM